MVQLLCSSFWSKAITTMPPPLCSNQESLLSLFYNASSSFFLLFLSLFLLLRFFNFIGNYPLLHRDQQYEYVFSEDEEEEEGEEGGEGEERYCYDAGYSRRDHMVADIVGGGQGLMFLRCDHHGQSRQSLSEDMFISPRESLLDEDSSELENHYASDQTMSVHRSPLVSDFETEEAIVEEQQQEQEQDQEQEVVVADADAVRDHHHADYDDDDSVLNSVPIESDLVDSDKTCDEDHHHHVTERLIKNKKVQEAKFMEDDRFFVLAPANLKTKRLIVEEKDEEEIYGDSCTVGSTSKSSSDWRSSVICRDSGTEDPFSSSSRRSCPKWESYTVFQKYDEEMTFLDRLSAQKLHETESLKSIHVSPRSISERIAYKFTSINKTPAHIRQNPYRELEAAYVAQICLTWEALNWNYQNFQSRKASCHDVEAGCPATVAQQFQQFQVLLQRYVENEPYEHGRRPEIYARMRLLAPKLLLVPEYRDSEDDQSVDDYQSRISTTSFLMIMEDGIRTFLNFLKADKEKPCQILAAYFKRNRRNSVDPTLLRLMKKVNQKKKTKVKDLRRSRKCLRKRKQKKEDQEMEILMALIDLKVVSRVLRMNDLSEEQLHWCEEKMSKVRVMDGKLQRDSTPLFFPATTSH